MKTDQGASEVQEQVEDGEEVLDPDNTSSVLGTVLKQSTTNLNMRRSGCWMSILFADKQMTVFQGTNIPFQACREQSFWGTRFGPSGSSWGDGYTMLIYQEHRWRMKWILERLSPQLQWQCFANWWLRKLWWGVHLPSYGGIPVKGGWFWQTTFPSIVSEKREWYPLQRLSSVPCRLLEIQTTLPQGHPALLLAHERILVVRIPGVAVTFNDVIDERTHGTDFKLINLLHPENANLTQEDLSTSIDEPENQWNIHHVSYDTLTSRAKPSSDGWLSKCAWILWIFDESHSSKTQNSVGWRIATNATIRFKLQVTATPGFHSLYEWYYQIMWLFSGAPDNPEDETGMEMHGADALYSAVNSLIHAIWAEDYNAQQDAAQWMIQIAKYWIIRRWLESKLANGKPLVRIPIENVHLVDFEWIGDKQTELKTLGERYTSCGASGAWRVHRWWLACLSVVLGDTEDRNDISGECNDEWPLDT